MYSHHSNANAYDCTEMRISAGGRDETAMEVRSLVYNGLECSDNLKRESLLPQKQQCKIHNYDSVQNNKTYFNWTYFCDLQESRLNNRYIFRHARRSYIKKFTSCSKILIMPVLFSTAILATISNIWHFVAMPYPPFFIMKTGRFRLGLPLSVDLPR